jgi:hypothetical protein
MTTMPVTSSATRESDSCLPVYGVLPSTGHNFYEGGSSPKQMAFFFFFFFFSFSNIEKAEGWAQGIKREITSNQKSSSEKELMGMFHDKVMKLSI